MVKAETTLGGRNKKQTIVNDLRNLLINSGLSEIYTYGFICEKRQQARFLYYIRMRVYVYMGYMACW